MLEKQLRARLASHDWCALRAAIDEWGHGRIPGLLTRDECEALRALYPRDGHFRSTVCMDRHRFGSGEYRYFARPLPALVETLRRLLYERLVPLANEWSGRLTGSEPFERRLAAYLRRCEAAGQSQPTPLLLRYEADGYNRLHQDLYGPLVFPLQVTVQLSRLGRDFAGGEFMLVEQRPRQQSLGHAIALVQGEAVVFASRERPVKGARGDYRAQLRHGVSRVERGERITLGVIFHDAR